MITTKRVTLSTGILRRPNKTKFSLVDVVNLNKERSRIVTVQVFDWSTGSPIPLKDRKLVTNVFDVTNAPFTPQEGDTVLQRSLLRIR